MTMFRRPRATTHERNTDATRIRRIHERGFGVKCWVHSSFDCEFPGAGDPLFFSFVLSSRVSMSPNRAAAPNKRLRAHCTTRASTIYCETTDFIRYLQRGLTTVPRRVNSSLCPTVGGEAKAQPEAYRPQRRGVEFLRHRDRIWMERQRG